MTRLSVVSVRRRRPLIITLAAASAATFSIFCLILLIILPVVTPMIAGEVGPANVDGAISDRTDRSLPDSEVREGEVSHGVRTTPDAGEASCAERLSSAELVLSQSEKELATLSERASACLLDLIEGEAGRNAAMQQSASLEVSKDLMREGHERKVKQLRQETKNATHDLERHKRHLKTSNDRYREVRIEAANLERELKEMHRRAITTYVNVTLAREGAIRRADEVYLKLEEHTEAGLRVLADRWDRARRAASPHLRESLAGAAEIFGRAEDVLGPPLRCAVHRVDESVGPIFHRGRRSFAEAYASCCEPAVGRMYAEYGAPYAERLGEARTALRLSAVSAVRQSSRAVAEHLEGLLQERPKSREPPRPPHLPPPRRSPGGNFAFDGSRRHMHIETRERSKLRKWLISHIQKADQKAETVADIISVSLVLLLLLPRLRRCLLAAAIFVLLLPFRPLMCLLRSVCRRVCSLLQSIDQRHKSQTTKLRMDAQ